MRVKEERLEKICKIIFWIMLLSVLLFLGIGEIVMPRENPTESGKCVLFEADWERVFSDGTRNPVEIPGQCAAERGEAVRLETTLPEDVENIWFCMRASQQDMRVYLDQELRKEYTTKETRFHGKNSASTYVFFEVTKEDAGKVLAIEVISDSEYAGFLNEIYVGDKFDIVCTLIKQCSVVIIVSIYMFILSSLAVLIGFGLQLVYKTKVDITYLGLGILLLSLSMIVESRIRQFFLSNFSIAAVAGFLLTILLPYPFMVYINRIQKGRYKKIFKILSDCILVNFIMSLLLHVSDIWDLADSMILSYGMIIVAVAALAFTICLDIKRGKIQDYGELIFGFIAIIIVSVWEVYLTFVPESPFYGGVVLSFGLIVLLFMAGIKTAKDLLAIEKEKQRAIAAGEAKAQFLANMSHEIRTPINTIIGMNEMILRENQDQVVREYASNVHNASKLLLGLINDILDFSKIEAGKLDILKTDYHLSKLLTDVMRGIQIKADSKKLKFHTNIEETLPSVLNGDEIRIRQIINNLLSNAVKYTHEGSVTFTVKADRDQEDFVLCISVEDTGIGIKPEDTVRLFDGFQRLEEQKNRHIEGTGLGLNITKQLVELMGGTIEVKSEHGKGSCFTVKIPQQIIDKTVIGKIEDAYQRDILKTEERKSKLYAPAANILVVDDNEMNLAVVEALLKRTGIQLTLAHGGMECLEKCRSYKYDLILMDHMMPELDGVETLHILRDDRVSQNRDTDVIALTANALAGMAEKYIKEGFTDYLAKPIVAEDLEDIIYRHLPEDKLENPKALPEDKLENAEALPEDKLENAEALPEDKLENAETMPDAEKEKNIISKNDTYISCIDKNAGLKYCNGNEEIYREMLAIYCSQGQKYVSKLSEYSEARDWKNYKVIVHALKSTSLTIGAADFSIKARRMEQLAGENAEDVLLAECGMFLEEYKKVLECAGEK